MLYLIRHAEAAGNAEGRIMGQRDLPLTDRGREQAQALGEWCARQGLVFGTVFASDLSRAWDTAAILARATASPAPVARPGLREVGRGELEGRTYAEARALRATAVGLEPPQIVAARISRVARELRAAALEGPVAAVGHGGSVARLLRFYLGLRPEPLPGDMGFSLQNSGVCILDFRAPRPALLAVNALPHLADWHPPIGR